MNDSQHAEMNPGEAPIVEIKHLSRRFDDKLALDDVSITIPKGQVFGLVGVNGAGKTTLIKHVLGLFKTDHRHVSVFGLSPSRHPEQVLAKIGYMSENPELPEWMKIGELIQYTKAYYPTWDDTYTDELLRIFELNLNDKVKTVSKGQLARTALLLALSHRPELLILDEPSSGLDPLVRRDILRTVIQSVAEDGRTVLFSSHLLEEVERIADHVAMIDDGKIIAQDNLDDFKQKHTRLSVVFEQVVDLTPEIPGFISWAGNHKQWQAIFCGSVENAESLLKAHGARIIDCKTPNLDDLFFALAGNSHIKEMRP